MLVKIPCLISELRLDLTLQCGQAFRWKQVTDNKWRGVIKNHLVTVHQDPKYLFAEFHDEDPSKLPNNKKRKKESLLDEKKCKLIIEDYFRLGISLEKLYSQWSDADLNFAKKSSKFPGIRMLAQDPVENVFSFICSSNNNIQRITQLVDKLGTLYGSPIASIDGTSWHTFPQVKCLTVPGVENTLRQNGFGYRAKYIEQSAHTIMDNGGEDWLCSLSDLPYEETHMKLQTLSGIGAKVADCICLMSMNHLGSIPVDTHVYQIAANDYLPHLKGRKTVTKKMYQEISNHFRKVFGEYAGWAHSILFCADLKKFEDKEDIPKRKNKS